MVFPPMYIANFFYEKMSGLVMGVSSCVQCYLPLGCHGAPMADEFMDAYDFAVWLCASQLRLLTAAEFSALGRALPAAVKGHVMVHLATTHVLPEDVAPFFYMQGQLLLAEHRRVLRASCPRVIML